LELSFIIRKKNKNIKQTAGYTIVPTSDATYALVTKVFDGDTIEIEGGEKVRYMGVDAAEIYPNPQCYAGEAFNRNKELVLGKVVRLEKDVSETDKYGRLLRFVYTGDIFVNDELTKNGFTKVMMVPPDVRNQNRFRRSENYAKENGLGLWMECL
jgi:micrococcal nuclease